MRDELEDKKVRKWEDEKVSGWEAWRLGECLTKNDGRWTNKKLNGQSSRLKANRM
jgi:hypothetical protein